MTSTTRGDMMDWIRACSGVENIQCALESSDYMKKIMGAALVKRIHPSKDPVDESIMSDLSNSDELYALLTKALSDGDYSPVEKFITDAFVRAEPSTLEQPTSHKDQDLAGAFTSEYDRGAESALYNYLTRCNKEFRESNYYGKFCSVVQSSGTGKSRTLIELRQKNVIVLYMNIRGLTETNSYPPRDDIVADILTRGLDDSADNYSDRCVSFFIALFDTLRMFIGRYQLASKNVVEAWSSDMCQLDNLQRARFFSELHRQYTSVLGRLQEKRASMESQLASLSIQDDAPTYQKVTAKTITPSGSKNRVKAPDVEPCSTADDGPTDGTAPEKIPFHGSKGPQLVGQSTMTSAYVSLLEMMVFRKKTDVPLLAIAIDEAHTLRQVGKPYTPSHILCRAISAFSTEKPRASVWVLFTSTVSRVADFSAPAYIHDSARISEGGSLLFRPFSKLYWDQRALPPGRVGPADAGKFENIVRFGRPLWQSLVESGIGPEKILATAGEKICAGQKFDPGNSDQALALLGVASHLRYCQGTTEDRSWQETSYPSEPLLSCAVARLLYSDNVEENTFPLPDIAEESTSPSLDNIEESTSPLPGNIEEGTSTLPMEQALVKLAEAVTEQLVDKGRKGELVSRLIYLAGKDFAVRKSNSLLITGDAQLLDCQPIPVSIYLGSLFDIQPTDETLLKPLEGWSVNFSHWVAMSDQIEFPGKRGTASDEMQEWLYILWTRTSAIQCCHQQKTIDKLIPMWHENDDKFSYILISDKAREKPNSMDLDCITPTSAGLPSKQHPYIAILAELAAKPQPAKFSRSKANGVTALRINALGIGAEPYKFMSDKPWMSRSLRRIIYLPDVSDTKETESEKKSTERSDFSSSSDPRHIHWKPFEKRASQAV
ncbi:hypothetical protein RhiJN_10506 [Ceratobasidium sp. AG-Ba]|nr:hypothetical protein RhiJN_10506 [Ceratobasidium sp. AG-Ba]QRW11239.1 hypothetical protein RhiLY_10238 [Ceratobasidium sp. AG-Ba]